MLWKLFFSLLYLFPNSSVDRQTGNRDVSLAFERTDYGPQTVEEMEEAFEALYAENDMMMPDDFMISAGIWDTKYRWPGYPGKAEVPYVIDEAVSSKKALIEQAMEQYNNLTCIKFVPRTTQKDYIKIIKDKGCKSAVGRQTGEQRLVLGDGCYYVGTIVHELGHALGLYHEHQRSDRDNYLIIYRNNITKGHEFNFNKIPNRQESILTDFNHNSIMIYGNYAFSKQKGKLMTMEAKNGQKLINPYSKPGMDDIDIDQIKKLYECK